MKFFKKIKDILLEAFYPSKIKCIFCGDELNEKAVNCTCENCAKSLPYISNACPRCGISMSAGETGVCFHCKSLNYSFDNAFAVFEYSGKIVNVIHKFKFGNLPICSKAIAGYMKNYFARTDYEVDYICCVPMFNKREKARGYNQSKLLANELADAFKIPYLDLCSKVKDNANQKDLDYKERRENVKDVYAFNKEYKNEIKGKTIMIIDDIFTTGTTTNEIAKLLKANGADKVFVFTFAHTPLPKDMKL